MWAQDVFGINPQGPSYGVAAPTQAMGTGMLSGGSWRSLLDPDNPLVWFGIVLAVTLGAAGVAGSVRLGKAKLSVDLDKE